MVVGRVLKRCLNVRELARHMNRPTDPDSQWDPVEDLDLRLYQDALQNDFLHFGYFDDVPDDPETISLADVKAAMERYADLLIESLGDAHTVLDVGCGTGGLLRKLIKRGDSPTGVTPNTAQIRYIREQLPDVPLIHAKFEDIPDDALSGGVDVVVMSESCQYIDIDAALPMVKRLIGTEGRWVISDYFRRKEVTRNKSGHLLEEFEAKVTEAGFEVVERRDITANVLPTLMYIFSLASMCLPLVDHTIARFKLKKPGLAYLLDDAIDHYKGKISLDTLNPAVFAEDKRYMRFILRSTSS